MIAASRHRRALGLELLAIAVAIGCVAYFTVASSSSAPSVERFLPATLGDQPSGAVVLAREDGGLAVGLAVAPRGGRLLLVATVFGQTGTGAAGLHTAFEVGTSTGQTLRATGSPCTAGCYEAVVSGSGRPLRAAVSLRGRGGVSFTLPRRWPAPGGAGLVRAAQAAYAHVRTLVTRERLASDATHVVYTTYYAAAPDRLRFQVRGGEQAIIVGGQRWDRQPVGRWLRSPQSPIRPIAPYWTPLVQDARVIGSATVGGRACWVIAFADPQTPGFFTIWEDKHNHRTLELEMTAAAHFMHHAYGPFDTPLTIRPPAGR
jgi:hypothetical protein